MIRDKQEAISYLFGYKKLIAWQKADLLAKKVYSITREFPQSEMFGLTSQLRRAALSVPANIIEGYARVNKNHFRNFLSIALGSLAEVDYFLSFAFEIKLISGSDYQEVVGIREESGRLIWRLYQSQK